MTKSRDDTSQRDAGTAGKVGELAATAGLTVRTLRYYDEIGLLSPSQRTSAGHRLYSAQDVERLYRIGLLRQLGLRLDEVAAALTDPDWNLLATMNRHIARLDQRLGIEHRLRNRLAAMADTPGPPWRARHSRTSRDLGGHGHARHQYPAPHPDPGLP
ncbi:DNA-binding transcriptional regulator, MerR family [Amycolatopsis arida]|uniref:DNA-binding transcriptional regulator, MerR family n=1 Tax=Amycolatopsis arida TaxID=587909 RepID=A0A1I5WLT9_9PSEU|nr:MerR family transcriptional regulator [Amycolatopsis arida]TDX92347.1 DNA-binding transcriptional MerR regulator [Amycolatopsis arida]SFQ20745.1 DNA-binding transcriptional regulator, MerR family [Amycolatopsis arida]